MVPFEAPSVTLHFVACDIGCRDGSGSPSAKERQQVFLAADA
jgi:hypothetical protein